MAASLGNATVNVLARTVLFEQSLKRSLKRMSLLTAGIFAGVASVNFFGSAVKDSIALERQVLRIKTLLDTPAEKGLFSNESVRELSTQIGISADKTAESLFYLLSSGIKASEAMDVLTQSSKTAVAQNADLAKVTDFASSALNAYGGQLDRMTGKTITAESANDILNRALDKGKGSMNDFAKYISSAIPIADSLGISLSEVASAGATSTLTGMSARKAFTGLKVAMQELNDPTKGLGKAFKELTGKTFRDFIAQGGTLEEGFKKLGTAIGSANITTVAGAKEGGAAIQQLLQLWPQYQDTLEAVGDSAGVTATKFNTVDKSLSRQLERVRVSLSNFRGSVGDWLGPVLADALNGLKEFYPKIKAAFLGFVTIIGDAFSQLKDIFGPVFGEINNALAGVDWNAVLTIIQDVVTGIIIGLTPLLTAVYGIFGLLAAAANYVQPAIDVLSNLTPIIVGLTAAFVAYKAILFLVAGVKAALTAVTIAQTIASGAEAVAFVISTLATEGLAAAFVALDIASGGIIPAIGIIVSLIIGLAAGLIYAWKKSETFREIVAGAFNVIKDTVVTVIQVVINAILLWVTAILESFHAVLSGLGHIPKWLGGGAFDTAASAVQSLINGVNDIRNAVNNLASDARAADWEIKKMGVDLMKVQDYAGRTSMDRLSLLRKGIDPDTTTALNASEINFDDRANPYTGGAADVPKFEGGGYNADDGKAAKKAADEAAKKVKAAMKRVLADVTRIAKNTSKQTTDTIKNNFGTLYTDLNEAGKKKLIPTYKKIESQLLKLASRRDGLEIKLEKATDKLKDLKDASKDFTDQIKEQVREMGNVADESKGLGTTYTGIRNQLRSAIDQTKRFTAYVNQLRKMKLNDTSLRQIIEAGPQAGMAAAKALVQSGQAGVNQIDKLQGQLTTAGNKLATSANDQFYAAGIRAAEGIVKGLEKEQAAIMKQMDKIADGMVKTIKKKLGIKSPSMVFGEIGENIARGLAGGIDSHAALAQKSAQQMTSQVVFGAGAVQVNGVSDPFAARRAGIISGEGIASVLDRRRTESALSQ